MKNIYRINAYTTDADRGVMRYNNYEYVEGTEEMVANYVETIKKAIMDKDAWWKMDHNVGKDGKPVVEVEKLDIKKI